MTTVVVYSFVVWNHRTGRNEVAPRKATAEAIATADGTAIRETSEEVEERLLDGNGFFPASRSGEPGREA